MLLNAYVPAPSAVYTRQCHARLPLESTIGALQQHRPNGGTPCPTFTLQPGSETNLRAHETVLDLVCRHLVEKKKLKPRIVTMTRAHKWVLGT